MRLKNKFKINDTKYNLKKKDATQIPTFDHLLIFS
jgi:hypothetical protein